MHPPTEAGAGALGQFPPTQARPNGARALRAAGAFLARHGPVAVIYAAVAVALYFPTAFLDGSRLTYTGDDVAEAVWDLAWLPHALLAGHDPFITYAVNYPYGANMASNTLGPLLGLVASPLTLGIGPIETYNLSIRLAFVLSALAMYAVLARYLTSRFARFVGGLMYAYSPYMIGQGHDHLILVFVPLPPLIFATLDELISGRSSSPRRCGLVLGALAGAELLISAEVFAGVALLCALALVYLALRYHRQLRSHLRRVRSGLAWAVGPLVLLGGWQTWALLFGAQRVSHNPAPYEIAQFREDLISLVIPTTNQAFGPQALIARGSSFVSTDFVENGLYLGIPLLVLTIVFAILARRRRLVGLASLLAAVGFVLSLGSPLNVNGHVTGIPLPFGLFPHLPLFEDEAASRYSLFVQLMVAFIVATGIDEVLRRRREAPARDRLDGRLIALGAALLAAFFPLVPHLPYPSSPTSPSELPAYFTDGGAHAIPRGSVVLTYPLPAWPYTEALLWQAQSRFGFRVVSGPWNAPQDPPDSAEGTPPLLHPSIVQVLFTEALYDEPASVVYGAPAANLTLPPNDAATGRAIRSFLRRYHVDTILIDPIGANAGLVTTYLTSALGRGPRDQGGVQVFSDVGAGLAGRG